ncbi:thiamine pyrophosphate-binding protein [Aeoliella sp. ICT_H6.2]|uniref:pyruvate decarboxylase n=1 Tax=Aeoliella straminimaris TaxID=2954799 RepID=A0A9X2F9U5_9BACT|nr:thiamine pyrophosphate-binding protein [Aeoliella straminimaris]MCO6044288.1 thiamine pyrophosphate-binding protein [Aeoliella straminimaris]
MADYAWTVGTYLATRLAELDVAHYFTVPGDYNLILLDEFLKVDQLQMVSCCNELNAGYAADGYARATGGLAAVVVTYSVGGLSALNAIAGAYAEDLPVVAISGAPNTNSTAEYEYLHHTLGKIDYDYVREIFARVTVDAVTIQHPTEAAGQIDIAIEKALRHRKPVYLEVACNIAAAPISAPNPRDFTKIAASDPHSLKAAVQHAARLLNEAQKPVLLAGPSVRAAKAEADLLKLVDATQYATAVTPDAKSFFDETHPNYMGIYWGSVGTPGCGSVVESADQCLLVGAKFTDYTTTGHTTLVDRRKSIDVRAKEVIVAGESYNNVAMAEFLRELTESLSQNPTALQAFKRIRKEQMPVKLGASTEPLTTRQLFAHVQNMLVGESAVIAETGDSWFNGIELSLPEASRFEIQMQYGSIGWSVGATLGYCLGAPERKVIACIGDGSFQLTAQEISTMLRYDAKPIVFLINNGGYTIEVEIHDGPYNTINNWQYARLVEVFNGEHGKGSGCRVATEAELVDAIAQAQQHDGLSLIEVMIDRDDCSSNLLEWGGHVARNNGRPPRFL